VPPFATSPLLAGVRHGFFGKQGGVSEGIYASLNAGPGSRDDPFSVAENRKRIAVAMGAAPNRFVSMNQVHSAKALTVDRPWPGHWPQADAIVATTPGLALGVLSADCAPVLLADAEAQVVAAAHAGWRGALGGILEAVVAEMEQSGAQRSRIRAAIGPTIQQASYEVGPEFEAQFISESTDNAQFFAAGAGDRKLFDLPAYCLKRLTAAGVNAVEALPLDTYALSDTYFSHRRGVHAGEADYGRNCAAIVLPA
jgi:YfiH family protein